MSRLHCPPGRLHEVGSIVGIDPGTNNLGFGDIRFNFKSLEILSVEGMSFNSERMLPTDSLIPITHNERIAKILAQKENLLQRLRFHRPCIVVCENPFINRLRPAAYGPLVEIVFAIRLAVIEYDPSVKFVTYQPSVIKKSVGAYAIGGKEEVKVAITQNPELNPNSLTDLSKLDEHAIDAIAAAYTYLLNVRKEYSQCSC